MCSISAGIFWPVASVILRIIWPNARGSGLFSSIPAMSRSISAITRSMRGSISSPAGISDFSFARPVTANLETIRSIGAPGLSGQRGVLEAWARLRAKNE